MTWENLLPLPASVILPLWRQDGPIHLLLWQMIATTQKGVFCTAKLYISTMDPRLLQQLSARPHLIVHVALPNQLGRVLLMIFVQAMFAGVGSVATQRDHLTGALLVTMQLMAIVEHVLLVTIVVHISVSSALVGKRVPRDRHRRRHVLLRKKI